MPPMPLLLALTTTPAEPQLSCCERSMSLWAPEQAEPALPPPEPAGRHQEASPGKSAWEFRGGSVVVTDHWLRSIGTSLGTHI